MAKKKNISAIVSGAGLLTAVWTSLATAVRKFGGTDDDLHRLSTPEGELIIEQMAQLIVRKENPWGISLLVDYDQPLEALVKQGNYGYANSDLSSANFPPAHKGRVMRQGGQLVHSGRGVTIAQAEAELDQMGLRPADIYELATFGIFSPKTQLEHPIVALGQRGVHSAGVGYLDMSSDCDYRGFYLSISIVERAWDGRCRFFAFPK